MKLIFDMSNINDHYISKLDLFALKEFFLENGAIKQFAKKEYLLRQDEKKELVGFVSAGIFRHTRIDYTGKEHIVGYSPTNHFVGDYTACLCHREALINIQAVKNSTVYVMRYNKLEEFFNSSTYHQKLGRLLAEQLYVMTYRRLVDHYCNPPEERYKDFITHYPELKELLPLREIASFIGVTPETVSHIRKNYKKP